MDIRRYRGSRPYVVYSERLPATPELLLITFLGFGLWVENWGSIPIDFLDRLPPIAQRLKGLVYMGAGLRDIAALERFPSLRTLSLDLDLRSGADLGELKRLKLLHLGGTGAAKTGDLVGRTSLRDVYLERVEQAHVEILGSGLRTLGLRKIRSQVLQLPPMPHLRTLILGQADDIDIAGIGGSREIRRIEIDLARSVTGFGVLATLPKLSALEVENVTRVDAPEVIDGLHLKHLNVQGKSPFSDAQLRAFDGRGVSGNRVRSPRREPRQQ